MAEPPIIPEYNKPDAPGIWMNFDNTVSVYYVVEPDTSFEQAAGEAFGLVRRAQDEFPGWPRVFFIDVQGHDGDQAGFDADFYEFQQEFFFSTLAPFLAGFDLPLTGALLNPSKQRDDLPDELLINISGEAERGE